MPRYTLIMRTRILRTALLLAPLLTLPIGAQTPAPVDPMEAGRRYTEWFYAGETAKLWDLFSPEMREMFGSPQKLTEFHQKFVSAGAETAIVEETVTPGTPVRIYKRVARFAKAPVPFTLQWGIGPSGAITGLLVQAKQEEAPTKHLDYRTKTPLRLPFEGEWFVGWGGRKIADNYHAASPDQRFAYDFLIERNGVTHTGDGTANEQYFCFWKPILAPGPGTVAVALDGIEDNKPGTMNETEVGGNHVVIDHGNGEFSFLAHLKKGSVRVKKGDKVEAGTPLGLCGNSGRSSEPHLHYHLQTTPVFFKGEGLPAQFLSYVADGKEVERGEPTKGQTVRVK
jgi:hypothetical protein